VEALDKYPKYHEWRADFRGNSFEFLLQVYIFQVARKGWYSYGEERS